MYQSHWGLRETPFRAWLDPRFFYQSPAHEEALARLHFLVEQRRRVGLLMGEPGSGKSLLLQVFAHEMRHAGRPVAAVNLLGLDQAGLLWQLAVGFGLTPDPSEGPAAFWQMAVDRIAEFRYQQVETVVLLDDADRATPEAITLATRLAQHDLSPESRLTLVLAGRHEQMGRIGRTLLELAELRIDLEPWQQADTEAYLKDAMSKAGGSAAVFDASAVARLHELAHGIPRRINHLADLALVAGAGQNLTQIDAGTIESVYHELGVIQV